MILAAASGRRSRPRNSRSGNLLGGEQSGHIDTVGFEMYMKLLEETIRELRGEELEEETRATVNLRIDLKIDPMHPGHESTPDGVSQGGVVEDRTGVVHRFGGAA